MTFTLGIDTSTWQDNSQTPQRIDWTKPALHGVKFVINRAVYVASKDDDFDYNWNGQRGKYARGAYGFWGYWPGCAPVSVQAQTLVNVLKPDPGELKKVYIDVEKANASYPALPPRSVSLPAIETYIKTVEDGLGLEGGLYGNLATLAVLAPIPDWLLAKSLWIAWPLIPTGETPEAYIARTGVRPPIEKYWPRPFDLWQYSWKGPGIAMGMESYGLDMNYFNGDEAAFRAWCGVTLPQPEPEEPPMEDNAYKSNALGYYAEHLLDQKALALDPNSTKLEAGWNNPGFAFYAADGLRLDGVSKPNQELKAMQAKAAELGKPFVVVIHHSMAYYTGMSYTAKTWPSDNMDYPMIYLKSIMLNRDFDELWIKFDDPNDHTGTVGDMSWLTYTLDGILKRIKEWKAANNRTFRVRVITSWQFMRDYCDAAKGGLAWLGNHDTSIKQPALTPLDASYPQAQDKPAWLGAIEGWKFWWYADRLIMFDGTAQELAALLGTPAPADPDPGGDPGEEPAPEYCTREEYEALYEKHQALQAQFTAFLPRFYALERLTMAHVDPANKDAHPHTHDTTGQTGGVK